MQIIKDESFGIVPVIKKENTWNVLLIKQISYRGNNDTFWTFPKGHAENSESPVTAARRELLEETGISDVVLEERQSFTMQYSFQHEGVTIDKTVTFMIGYCSSNHTCITQPQEVAELRWCSFSEAKSLLAHKNAQIILTEVEDFLSQPQI